MFNFKKIVKRKIQRKNNKTKMFLKTYRFFLKMKKDILMLLSDSKIFPPQTESTGFSQHSSFKISIPKQMLQRLPIALAQVKPVNTSENLLNEISKMIYFLYCVKRYQKGI